MYFTLSSGMELYYEDTQYGDEVLLMLHGVTSNHTVFSQPAEILKGKVRCIFYDQRGHLNSRYANKEPVTMETLADDLNEIINGLSLKNVNLLGWSMGAGVIMTYVKKYGCGALKQVILCDMTPRQLNDESWQLGLDRGRYTADVVRKMESKSFKVVVREFARGVSPKLKKLPFFVVDKIVGNLLADCDVNVIKSLFNSMKTQDNRDAISKLTVPLTYIYARPGSLFSPRLALWYREQAKMAKIRFTAVGITESTHLFINQHPDKFAWEVSKLI